MKKLTTYIFYAISIFSLVYFTIKYYHDKSLNFDYDGIIGWTIIIVIILTTLGIGIFNCIKIKKLEKQNVELLSLVKELCERQEYNNENTLLTLQNSREISLDILNEMKEK